MKVRRGRGSPLGPSVVCEARKPDGTVTLTVNIAVYAMVPRISVCVFPPVLPGRLVIRDMDEELVMLHRTGGVWHIELHDVPYDAAYAFRLHTAQVSDRLLCDPYAKWVESPGADMWMTAEGERDTRFNCGDKVQDIKDYIKSFPTLRRIGIAYPFRLSRFTSPIESLNFDWKEERSPQIPYSDLFIYESHVKALTSEGTFSAAIRRIPYLKWLGITALQLMPILEFSEMEMGATNGEYSLLQKNVSTSHDIISERQGNMWGYSPMSWFSPMNRYSSQSLSGGSLGLKQLVQALHEAGIECILDVVYNHSANSSCAFHFFNTQSDYYIGHTHSDGFKHSNISGCGNTLSPNSPLMHDLILQSLRWLVTEYRIDGFRLDAAGVLCRDEHGKPLRAPALVNSVCSDPVLRNVKFIVEGWDAGDQVGSPNMLLGSKHGFPRGERFCEWNAHWRDSVRKFVRGDKDTGSHFCNAIMGYPNFFGDGRTEVKSRPLGCNHSVNFVACHDGLCLADVVSFAKRVNSDGYDEICFNCGRHGSTRNPIVNEERARQVRNFIFALAISRGIPMICQGDEFGFSKAGNSNTWNNPHMYAAPLPDFPEGPQVIDSLVQFTKRMFSFRQSFDELRGSDFHEHVKWLDSRGKILSGRKFETRARRPRLVAFVTRCNKDNQRVYIAFNTLKEDVVADLPMESDGDEVWEVQMDTFDMKLQGEQVVKAGGRARITIRQQSAVLCIGTPQNSAAE